MEVILINILLVDDHILFAKSLAIAFEEYEEIENFYTTQEIQSLEETIRQKNIDIVLMDINLGKLTDNDGLNIAGNLIKDLPALKIIILTGYDLPVYKYEAQKLNISGFLNKNISPDKLFEALMKVHQGYTCFPSDNNDPIIEELTNTERKILSLISCGKKRKEIAKELYISERTLSNHLQHIYEKLSVTSSVEAVTKAIQMGYISPLF
ncbi:TPA: response regulator transcription factor [Clostridioides difficile]|uniref:response regulator transcription factor n=1 Tax=Clostridioides difficile TaxID=1496 RepID=UPI00094422AC|nr:response regulator transcription factor [Clostridioides difficile]MBJ9768023.1 response regulator transcription factor [Clostridioides difficile]VFE47733.1 salavaricin two-component response regulator [Clostridioides difficile]VFH02089.1 salavaricin two-component response regulator [Clostridioides difficile]VIB37072.1 salavaricin two-component response regulator [Clostridioides difficile]VIB66958.1 salavaricin two-component response regulator [Clostridioides difficile]